TADTIAYILDHGESSMFIVDQCFLPVVEEAMAQASVSPKLVVVKDPTNPAAIDTSLPFVTYEAFLGMPSSVAEDAASWSTNTQVFPDQPSFGDLLATNITDEWQALALGYTSGTTARPKGVVYHHRGGYLNAVGNILSFGVGADSGYLWTLPMFHCNGWTYPWGISAAGGTHICLRNLTAENVFASLRDNPVTHFCAAPVVLNMLIHAPESVKHIPPTKVKVATGGAAPATAIIEGMENLNLDLLHTYGLTETYGPATYCFMKPEWDALPAAEKSTIMARQGIGMATLAGSSVKDAATGEDVPADTETLGEVTMRGNTVMKGYLKDPEATRKAFAHGWFFSGDLAVRHPDNYAQIKDRAKDIIISGGENISSLEIEEVLFKHPDIIEAAVVAKPHDHWGEVPCAFITLKPSATYSREDMDAYCRARLASFKIPKHYVTGDLPKTSTGKVQKFLLRQWALDAA
ncbi:MAG: AMP-binding protein, partial [Alphaproteobacteria bacterium]|nr:AMP-binding protein [Alphaproteobacteria bacterium]